MGRLLLLPMFLFTLSVWSGVEQTDCPIITQPVQDFCESEGTGNNFYRPTVSHLSVISDEREVLWYSSSEGGDPLPSDFILVDGEIYYADFRESSCGNRPSVSVTVAEAPNAGSTTRIYFCSNGGARDFYNEMNSSQLGPPDRTGTFNRPLSQGPFIFDPAVDEPGRYTYTVQSSNGKCPADDALYYLYIDEAPDAGQNADAYFETIDPAKDLFTFLNGTPEAGGTWSPPLTDGIFDPKVNTAGLYTYTVFGAGDCKDTSSSSTVSVTVNYTTTTVCHNGQTALVNNSSLKGHLKHGDVLGGCDPQVSVAVVSPNPSTGVFQVTGMNSDIKQVKVHDFNGGVLRNFNNQGQGKTMQIDITDLKQGIYFAEIRTNNGKQVERIVKE